MARLPLAPYTLSTCRMLVIHDLDARRTTDALVAGVTALAQVAGYAPYGDTPAEAAEQALRALAEAAYIGGVQPGTRT